MTAPFGIKMYSHLDELDVLGEFDDAKYIVTPPKPHPNFETYLVQATPNLGVVWIKAVSPLICNDAYGNLTIQAMERIRGQLELRYGPGELTDYLMFDSIWSEPRDWSNAVEANERVYSFTWEKKPHLICPSKLRQSILEHWELGATIINFVLNMAPQGCPMLKWSFSECTLIFYKFLARLK